MTQPLSFAYHYKLTFGDQDPTVSMAPFHLTDIHMLTAGTPEVSGFKAFLEVMEDGTRIDETGVISFADGSELTFVTVALGIVTPKESDGPDRDRYRGMIMWRIIDGTGFFKGARGHITSNYVDFLARTSGDHLYSLDHHLGLVFFDD